MTSTIPVPPAVPFLGHVTSIEKEVPLRSFSLLSKQYGEIYQLNLLGRTPIFVNTAELVNDVSDEKKFSKAVTASLVQVRNAIGDGLFTAYKDEPGWGIAHRLLMPAFGTASIRDMFPDMLDVAQQLVLKWERFGPRHKIDPADDFTRLTLDTIALCSMSYRLNSFYRESNHPFVTAMVDFLTESGLRANRPSLVNAMMRGTSAKYEQDIKTMAELADEIIEDRRSNPIEKNDLLNTMLYSTDPKTGDHLKDETIRNNLLTFLIAGHETTSGLLTFTLYYLIKYPDTMRKAREEVDEVLGDGEIQLTDLGKLKYIVAAMRESLRLSPTAPVRTVSANEDTVIGGGKYFISKGQSVVINAERAQRDPKVYGDDADVFKPERMLDGKFEALPANAWQPFGFGMRACIGRPFAWQEAQMALALIIQKFDFSFEDPSYELELKQ